MNVLITANGELVNWNQVISITTNRKSNGGYNILVNTAIYNYQLISHEFNDEASAKSFLLNNVMNHFKENNKITTDFRKIKV